jgi:tyrosyl-tRNA synthetase
MLSTSDTDVERYLKLFTFLPLSRISEVVSEHTSQPEKRLAQHLLASEFLALAYGRETASQTAAEHTSRASSRRVINIREHLEESKNEAVAHLKDGPKIENMSLDIKAPAATASNSHPQTFTVTKEFLETNTFASLLYAVGLVGSKSEAHRLIGNHGAYVGGQPSKNPGDLPDDVTWRKITNTTIGAPAAYVVWSGDKGLLLLRVGKWKVRIVRVYPQDKPILENVNERIEQLETTAAAGVGSR